ncbi:hypothetical protein AQ505_21625 [Pedobacter sp. PACM 27299]|uniref:YdeI/OmpD-associated family protein n=1 Tax=Pedobacter sp. PACM 27299 TaxID=1727164 RepID=UPI0007060D9E|nr:DUF1801 domain-containing protein [Pedobacter sp. PACM 27299]ALL07864.1 hypothetical protein AQ505_21625 [Pedobacter sp. PACM 27299]
MNPQADFYFNQANKWSEALLQLRKIVLDCGLQEELKWGSPCYSFQEKNIVLIHTFKAYCALLFFKGALLNNDHGLLIQQTKNVQAARQIRFTNALEIIAQQALIKSYIHEAIAVEKAGLKVDLKETAEFPIAQEFQHKLKEIPALNTAFNNLTPGRQRAYLLYFAAPKQSKTREARIEKCMPSIINGKGLKD